MKECKFYFLVAALIFFGLMLVGYVFPVFFVELIQNFIKQIAQKTQGMGFFQLFVFVLQNNLLTAFLGMIGGVLFGIFPVITSAMNGYVLGFVMNKTAAVAGSGVLLRLLPHGIFELPALIISLGLGIRLGAFIFAKKKKEDFVYALENSLKVFLLVVIPLLLVAALIESWLIVLLG